MSSFKLHQLKIMLKCPVTPDAARLLTWKFNCFEVRQVSGRESLEWYEGCLSGTKEIYTPGKKPRLWAMEDAKDIPGKIAGIGVRVNEKYIPVVFVNGAREE